MVELVDDAFVVVGPVTAELDGVELNGKLEEAAVPGDELVGETVVAADIELVRPAGTLPQPATAMATATDTRAQPVRARRRSHPGRCDGVRGVTE